LGRSGGAACSAAGRHAIYLYFLTISADAEGVVAELRTKPGKDIALFGGGKLFRSLLAAGLVDGVGVR
jgi:dihydrofolate reductase